MIPFNQTKDLLWNMWKNVIEIMFLSNQMNIVFLLLSAPGFYARFLPCKKKKKKKKKKWYPWNQENKLVVYLFELCSSNTRFFISNIFVRKTWLKLAKNKAKAKQRPEAIWKLFTFFIHHLRFSNVEYSKNVINSFMTEIVIT